MLADRRILVTGVLDHRSIAFATAKRAQELGAEVLLTGFGRTRRMTERAARQLPVPADVLELDVNRETDIANLAEAIRQRWGGLDGVLHAIAYAPPDALGGDFMATSLESATIAYQTSAVSLKTVVAGLVELLEAGDDGGAVVGLDFDASLAWPAYDWMGVAKAALEAVSRYLSRELGPRGVRANLVAAGPIETLAAGGIPQFAELAALWEHGAPLGWDPADAGPVADACCFLLSPLARAITGEIVHVDGGFHAVGAPAGQPLQALAAR